MHPNQVLARILEAPRRRPNNRSHSNWSGIEITEDHLAFYPPKFYVHKIPSLLWDGQLFLDGGFQRPSYDSECELMEEWRNIPDGIVLEEGRKQIFEAMLEYKLPCPR